MSKERVFHPPVWDRGEPVDPDMLAFTIGDDWRMDQRLVVHDLQASRAHARGLRAAGLLDEATWRRIEAGLLDLLREHRGGGWTVEPGDEDVHSAIERRLVARIGEDGKRLHLGRSRNEQVAVAMRLWLRDATTELEGWLRDLETACAAVQEHHGDLPLPGYTHLRRAMPSSVGDWAAAHAAAFRHDREDLDGVRRRLRWCPLGSGSGYGVPLPLDRERVARELGFAGPEEPVTAVQHGRGRAELAWLTVLEGAALNAGKLVADLWLFTTAEFGFAVLPAAFTTGSSLMPQKRNPDLLELARAHCRQVVQDRAALLAVLQDLPSGYHRDFQLLKPPLFRARDRMAALLPLMARLLPAVEWQEAALREAAADPALHATGAVLRRAVEDGVAFRDAYREEAARSPDAGTCRGTAADGARGPEGP